MEDEAVPSALWLAAGAAALAGSMALAFALRCKGRKGGRSREAQAAKAPDAEPQPRRQAAEETEQAAAAHAGPAADRGGAKPKEEDKDKDKDKDKEKEKEMKKEKKGKGGGDGEDGPQRELTGDDEVDFGFRREEFGQKDPRATVKEHSLHVFYGTGPGSAERWPKKVELGDGPMRVWKEQLALCQKGREGVNLTAYDGPEGHVLVFPACVRYSLGPGGVDAATALAVLRRHVDGDMEAAGLPPVEPLGDSAVAFVCTHNSRDRRCGVCGPALVDGLRRLCRERGILPTWLQVHGCSHIGGHVYAGNVLVFAPREPVAREPRLPGRRLVMGDWYGMVGPGDLPALLDCVVGGIPYLDLWRGRLGLAHRDMVAMVRDSDPDWKGCGEDCACAAELAREGKPAKFKVDALTL